MFLITVIRVHCIQAVKPSSMSSFPHILHISSAGESLRSAGDDDVTMARTYLISIQLVTSVKS